MKRKMQTKMSGAEAASLLLCLAYVQHEARYSAGVRTSQIHEKLVELSKEVGMDPEMNKFVWLVLYRLNCYKSNPSHFGRYISYLATVFPKHVVYHNGNVTIHAPWNRQELRNERNQHLLAFVQKAYAAANTVEKVRENCALPVLYQLLYAMSYGSESGQKRDSGIGKEESKASLQVFLDERYGDRPDLPGDVPLTGVTNIPLKTVSKFIAGFMTATSTRHSPKLAALAKAAKAAKAKADSTTGSKTPLFDYGDKMSEARLQELIGNAVAAAMQKQANNAHDKGARVAPAKRGSRGMFQWHEAPHPGIYAYAGANKNRYDTNVSAVLVTATGAVSPGWYAYICDTPALSYPEITVMATPSIGDLGEEVMGCNGAVFDELGAVTGKYRGTASVAGQIKYLLELPSGHTVVFDHCQIRRKTTESGLFENPRLKRPPMTDIETMPRVKPKLSDYIPSNVPALPYTAPTQNGQAHTEMCLREPEQVWLPGEFSTAGGNDEAAPLSPVSLTSQGSEQDV